jgi:hypothetical protein
MRGALFHFEIPGSYAPGALFHFEAFCAGPCSTSRFLGLYALGLVALRNFIPDARVYIPEF